MTSERSMSPLTGPMYMSGIWSDRTGIILKFCPKRRVIFIVFYPFLFASAVRTQSAAHRSPVASPFGLN